MITTINKIIDEQTEINLNKESFGNISLIKSHKEIFVKNINDFRLFISDEENSYTNSIIIYVVSNELVTLEDIINLSIKVKEMFEKQIYITFGRKIVKDLDYILVDVFLSSEKRINKDL